MEATSNSEEYQKLIGTMVGHAFEEEVCARLQSVFVDFQRIPAKPQGDGGLDGLSHGQDRAYCCYGPEQESRKLDNQGLKDDIIEKFAADLRKLFELELHKKRLRCARNNELASIMGEGRKIKNLFLIVSWFESHRVIGPLNTRFDKYKATSKLQFIDAAATLTVWGPKDLSTLGAVDEHTLFRIQNPSLIASVQTASAAKLVNDGGDFDAKFDDLKRRRPGLSASIDGIAHKLREAWAAAIALDNDLSKNSVGLHQTLESVRSNAALSAQVKSMGATDPYHLIDKMREEVTAEIEKGYGNRFGPLTSRIAQGIVAGLVGECPIEWRDNHA